MIPASYDAAPILILGGTGKTGRRVVERLDRTRPCGAGRLPLRRAAIRLGGSVDMGAGVAWRRGRLSDVLSGPGDARSRRRGPCPSLTWRWRSGVQRLVLLSGRGEDEAERAEARRPSDAGVDWTILRCSWFAQNFSENYLLDAAA